MDTSFLRDFRILKQKNPRGYSAIPSQCFCIDTLPPPTRAALGSASSVFVTVNSLPARQEEDAYTIAAPANVLHHDFALIVGECEVSGLIAMKKLAYGARAE